MSLERERKESHFFLLTTRTTHSHLLYNQDKRISKGKDLQFWLNNHSFDRHVVDQLKRASFSIMLNIAEGTSRYSAKDRRNFFIISRGSAFECVAILEYLSESERIAQEIYQTLVSKLEEISRMLYSLY